MAFQQRVLVRALRSQVLEQLRQWAQPRPQFQAQPRLEEVQAFRQQKLLQRCYLERSPLALHQSLQMI